MSRLHVRIKPKEEKYDIPIPGRVEFTCRVVTRFDQ